MKTPPRLQPFTHLIIGLMAGAPCPAADLIQVLPVTDSILMLQFDEGHLDYQGKDENRYDHIGVYASLLDTTAATAAGSYQLQSPDDPAYSNPQQPVAIGRKSKGAEFNNIYQPAEPAFLSDHSIYLALPTPLRSGKNYTLTFPQIAANRKSWTLVFDTNRLRSETVRVNQLGYTPESRKFAYLSHWMGDFDNGPHLAGALSLDDRDGAGFHLLRLADRMPVYSGTISKRKSGDTPETERVGEFGPNLNYSRTDIWEADFSSYAVPGEYVLAVDGIGHSYPFRIAADVHREAFYHAMKGLFVQRSGVAKEVEPGWILPRGQHPDMPGKRFFANNGKRVYGIWGWYHDAGDWDGYLQHATVPAMLLLLYDLKGDYFVDGDIANRLQYAPDQPWIDEGTNGLPDLLDEASWLIHCFRRTRHALIDQGLGTGGVPDYYGVDSGFEEKPSWEDPRDLRISAENVENTYNYAGLAAWYALCLDRFAGGQHPEAAEWRAEAQSAWEWASARNSGTNAKSRDFAAAALYRATGMTVFQEAFLDSHATIGEPAWTTPLMSELAGMIYALSEDSLPGLDTARREQVRTALITLADTYEVDYAEDNRGFRFGGARPRQRNFLGIFSTPKTSFAAVAHHLTGDPKYLNAVRSTVDYFLGGNEMNLVWMTGVGHNPDVAAFHLDSWYSMDFNSKVYRNPIAAGLVPYGTYSECDWFGCGWNWIGDEDFSRSTAYPPIADWPTAETRFQNRHNIPGSEFTVHQTLNHAIFSTGYLVGTPEQPFRNARPTVSLLLAHPRTIAPGQAFPLTVQASPDTRRVQYYYDFHYIGESTDATRNFRYDWDVAQTGLKPGDRPLITAVAYDSQSKGSWPSQGAEALVEITDGNATDPTRAFLEAIGEYLGGSWYATGPLGDVWHFPQTSWIYLEAMNGWAWIPEEQHIAEAPGFWMFVR